MTHIFYDGRTEETRETSGGVPDGGTPTDSGPDLSVVVVTENEADRVRTCIESVFDACAGVAPFEVILVDSASTDETVAHATDYPITVLRIPEAHTVSRSAGRYVGDQLARGDLVLHVDGDAKLMTGWLSRAVSYLRSHDVAGVEGELNESTQDSVTEVSTVGGAMLLDAEMLRSVGGFDPFLDGYEDVDVSFRLQAAGYSLVRLPVVSATRPETETFFEPIRRWRHGQFFAPGQAIRKSLGAPRVLARLVRQQQSEVVLLGWLALGGLSLFGSVAFLGWLAVSILGVVVMVSKRGLRGGLSSVLAKLLGMIGIAVGLRRQPTPPEAYPLDTVEVVKQGLVHDEDGVGTAGWDRPPK